MKFTYQTRLSGHGDALSAYASLYSRLERKLFARVHTGESRKELKQAFIRDHRIPARMFNGMWASLQGKIKAVGESQEQHADTLRGRIAQARKQLAVLERRGDRSRVHHKRRRLANLESRLAGVEGDIALGRVRLCFGSRKLWRKQFNLGVNGYGSHREWLLDWWESRDSQFFVLGSRDETAGCQLCVASVSDDGSLDLRVRMPDCLAGRYGKYLAIEGLRFDHGHEAVLSALQSNAEFTQYRREHGEQAARETDLGEAVSYRFMRDSIGWRVFVTVDVAPAPVVTDRRLGAVGVDLNADHLAVIEMDSSGNWLRSWRVPLVTYGKSSHQAEALIGDAVAGVAEYARNAHKPIVIERLDFRRKKAVLEGESRKYSRMLSSFSYGKIKASFISRGHRQGVEVHQVNPAFSSVIGRVKFVKRYGLSVHQAAALVLARRLPGCSERIPRQRVCPLDNGVRIAFTVPVRKRVKHVWTYWGAISGQLGPALAAQHRQGKRIRGPDPAQAGSGAKARGDGLGGDPFGFPGCESRAEPPCAVGAAGVGP